MPSCQRLLAEPGTEGPQPLKKGRGLGLKATTGVLYLKEVLDMEVNRHSKVKHLLISVVKVMFNEGKTKSKHIVFQENYEKYERRESHLIHSYSTYQSYKTTAAKFADFMKQEYGIKYEKDFMQLTAEELYTCIDRYFEKQKEAGLSQNTLERHISALNKILPPINPDIKEFFNAENRARWRDGLPKQDCDRYDNSDRVIENLRKIDETSAAIAELQRLTGARIGDIKKLQVDEENQRVFIPRSKGGRDRTIYFDRFQEEFEKVKQYKEIVDRALQEKKFSEIRENQYYEDLKKACRQSHEVYHGAHAFRYEFAQSLYEKISTWTQEEQEKFYRRVLEDRRISEDKIEEAMNNAREKDAVAVAIVSEALGHSRLDISMEYLKLKGK